MNKLLFSLFLFFAAGLSSCQWEDAYTDKAFLSFKYRLEDCADIRGQDPTVFVGFSDYKGIYYTDLFDCAFDRSFLDFRVIISDGHAIGKGHLLLTLSNGSVLEDFNFEYYCTAIENNYRGLVIPDQAPERYETWVYSIYWCRLSIECVFPGLDGPSLLTFNFRGGEENPVPEVFYSNHA